MKSKEWIQKADDAMVRAAARAIALAASTNTSIHVMKDGKIVKITPKTHVRREE
jgi:apolipoprotein N-acyltransferase